MKITVYELLGMVVEDKAPKKIKYNDQEWEYNPINDYEGTEYGGCLLNQITLDHLNDEVEIIEEDVEITKWDDFAIDEVENKQLKMDNIKKYIAIIMRTQNEIIDEVKKLKGK